MFIPEGLNCLRLFKLALLAFEVLKDSDVGAIDSPTDIEVLKLSQNKIVFDCFTKPSRRFSVFKDAILRTASR